MICETCRFRHKYLQLVNTYEGETYNYVGCRLNAQEYRDIFSDTCEVYEKEWDG